MNRKKDLVLCLLPALLLTSGCRKAESTEPVEIKQEIDAIQTDARPEEPELSEDARQAYLTFFEQKSYEEDFAFPDSIRYEYLYLDEDDCPELFLCEGSGTAFPFRLYRYDPDSGSIVYTASFSQQGRVRYRKQQGQIVSVYGNMGDYTTMVSQVSGDSITLLGVLRSRGNLEEAYYTDFPLPEEMQGQHFDDMLSLLPEPDPACQVSYEEYEARYQELIDESQIQTITYDDMKTIPER